jgi:hypothetical protein
LNMGGKLSATKPHPSAGVTLSASLRRFGGNTELSKDNHKKKVSERPAIFLPLCIYRCHLIGSLVIASISSTSLSWPLTYIAAFKYGASITPVNFPPEITASQGWGVTKVSPRVVQSPQPPQLTFNLNTKHTGCFVLTKFQILLSLFSSASGVPADLERCRLNVRNADRKEWVILLF